MTRAETTIGPIGTQQRSSQSSYMVKTPAGELYVCFASQADNSLYWAKSADGGFSWTDPVLVRGLGGNQTGFCVWYDKWTPGNTGTLIHLAYFEQTGDDVFYRSLDTSSDTLGTEVLIVALTSSAAPANTNITLTRAIGGNLLVGYDIDGGTETGVYRSVDAGANWTVRANVNEAGGTDYYLFAPGFAADTQDIICVYWDRSASEISRKLYDDSGDAWAETSISGGMTALASSTAAPQFSICVDDANNKILLAAWSAADTANADLRFWSIDEASITEGTNIVLNSADDQGMVSLALNTGTTTLYAFYGGNSDGSQTFPTAIALYYKTSSDGGATWGAETQLTLFIRGYDYLMSFPVFTGDFGLMFESQTAALDTLYYSPLLPSGGGGLAGSIFGGQVVR